MKTIHIFPAFLIIIGLISCGNQAGPAQKGVLESYSGSVFIDGKPADTGIEIVPGTVITTGEGGWCDVLFTGKNVIRIFDNSKVEFILNPGDKQISLKAGSIGNVLTDLKDWKNGFQIETETAVVIVRGTVFFVSAESPTNTYICCCNGSLEIKEKQPGKADALSAPHHQGLKVGLNGSISAGLLYHNDDDMDSIAAVLKKRIDWKKAGGLFDLE